MLQIQHQQNFGLSGCRSYLYGDISTWLVCNFLIAVAVHGPISNELDPVLHLGNPGIHTIAGAFCTKTHHTDSRESIERNEGSCVLHTLHSTYLPFSETINGPPESPWHESLLLSPAQMWKLNMSIYFLYLLVKIILIPFNFARIISVTLFVRHDRHLNLLQC